MVAFVLIEVLRINLPKGQRQIDFVAIELEVPVESHDPRVETKVSKHNRRNCRRKPR